MIQYYKIVFTAIILFFFTTSLHAQFNTLGIKGGLNLSNLNYKDDLQGCEYALNTNFSIHAEFIFSMRGTEYSIEEKSIDGQTIPEHKFIQKLNYIEIPLFFQYKFVTNSQITPKLFLGPIVSFLLEASLELIQNNTSMDEIDQNDDFKFIDYGIKVGIGIEYLLESGKVVFDIRYHYGIPNINNIERGSEINSSTLAFNIGYGFNLEN